jgi:hypothetical protein
MRRRTEPRRSPVRRRERVERHISMSTIGWRVARDLAGVRQYWRNVAVTRKNR